MPSYGQSVTIQYVAWNTAANAPQTGDAANHTLRWVKDGTSAAPTNSPSEVDGTGAPGVYKVALTATECQCQSGTLCGKSSTANVSILPVTYTFENLPIAAPAAAGGLPTIGTGSGQISPSGGAMPVAGTVVVGTNHDKSGYTLDLTQPVPTSNTAQTVGDAFNAARAQGFGKWVLSGTTLTLYAPDGSTAVRTFILDSATAPTQRS